MTGRLIGVVGPSGAGKDSLMRALAEASPSLRLVRRVITRPSELGGEDFDSATEADFQALASSGGFCVHWVAHGLRYGIPAFVQDEVAAGQDMLVNLSRTVLHEVAAAFPAFRVLHVTAHPDTLVRRLEARGRETPSEIANRLSRAVDPLPGGLDVATVQNDGSLQEAVEAALTLLDLARG